MASKKKTTPAKEKGATKRKMVQPKARKAAPKKARTAVPKPGTKLTREFKGKTVTVQVTEEGFRYGGKTYHSLTALAKHITGYPSISGPAFFGLTTTAKEKGK